MDDGGATAANTRTDEGGRFRLDDVPAGRYRVRVEAFGYVATAGDAIELRGDPVLVRVLVEPAAIETEGITVRVERLAVARFGYDSTATANVAVAPDQDLYLELEVQPAAVGLDPIRVTAPRTIPYLESTGFYGRMRRGHGTFFSPRELERAPSAFPTHFLRRVAGLSVRHDGSITIRGVTGFMGGPCSPTIVVDGIILRDMAPPPVLSSSAPPDASTPTLGLPTAG